MNAEMPKKKELIKCPHDEIAQECESCAEQNKLIIQWNACHDDFLTYHLKKMGERVDRPKIICLCGSSRFIDQIAIMGWMLEKEGAIVLGLHLLPANYPDVQPNHQAEAEGLKEKMDELHKRKIDLADEILIMNVNGYIGESTRSEIEYTKKLGKPIKYLEAIAKEIRE